MNDDEALARTRFMLLNLVRLGGLAMVLVGMAIHYGRIPAPEPVGLVLVAAGFAEFFFLPRLLARKWRTPRQ